jgi:hypothetical protein
VQSILWLNEFLNRRAPVVKKILHGVMPHDLRTKFAERKFTLTIEDKDYSRTFTNIHSKNWWGSSESVSGYGSQLNRTVTIRRELPKWMAAAGIRSIFDAPCGDYNWISDIIKTSDVVYRGGDIVTEIIRSNHSQFAVADRVSFDVFDILKDPLPEADAWLCRDVLFHFPNDAVAAVLDRFCSSQIRYLLTTHFSNTAEHKDIRFGGYRPVNLCRPPFNWPAPSTLIFDGDGGSESDRYLGIWQNPRFGSAAPKI